MGAQIAKNRRKSSEKTPGNSIFQQDVHVKVRSMMKTRKNEKVKCFGLQIETKLRSVCVIK